MESAHYSCVALTTGETYHRVAPGPEVPVKVAIVEDDDLARFLLQKILEQSGAYDCVGSYASAEEALQDVPRVTPQVVLMDIILPGMSGIECTRLLKGLLRGLIVVFVSGLSEPEIMAQALAAGGDGYLTKPFAIAQCLATLTFSIRRGASPLRERNGIDRSSIDDDESLRLTGRENEVMAGFAKGLLYKEIADGLGISYSAVNKYQRNIFKKFHVNNRIEALNKWGQTERISELAFP